MISSQEIERMKRDSHFDPLRVRLREQADTLRRISETIGRYLSSPAQCSVEAALKFQNEIQAAAPVRQLHDAQAERVFQAVVYAYEGREVPTDLLNHGMVRRAMKFRAAAAVPSSPAQEVNRFMDDAKYLESVRNPPVGGAFHWRDGYYFQRTKLGAVVLTKPDGEQKVITPNEWASIIAHVSEHGDTADSFAAARAFHGGLSETQGACVVGLFMDAVRGKQSALPPSSAVADSPTWLKGRCWTCGEAKNHGWHGTPRGLGPGVLKTDFHTFVPMPKLSAPSPSAGAAKENKS